MHGVMIAIKYSYKLDRKNYFNLWCELGWFLFRQSHMVFQYQYAINQYSNIALQQKMSTQDYFLTRHILAWAHADLCLGS